MWDRTPDAAALLADRVARGWAPLPSPLVTGPQVLGYAACLAKPE